MAKRKQEEAKGGGAPAWMATFSDLMNLLLCFFVLLFSMSSVDAERFEMVIASLQSSFSVLPAGGSSVGEGQLISSGISQLEYYQEYLQSAEVEENTEIEEDTQTQADSEINQDTEVTIEEEYKQLGLAESEQISEAINEQVAQYGIQSQVEVDFNGEFVLLTLNGALLFDSGQADIRADALPLVDKVGAILSTYSTEMIEIEGHTDNVPISNNKFSNNDVLSMFRALSVADYIRSITDIKPSRIKSAGRGEYVPIADNTTVEGRAKNRRVEIKIYNSYSSSN